MGIRDKGYSLPDFEPIAQDTRKFCSSIESDCERAFGPFDTEEEAVAAATEERDEREASDTECVIGRCNYPDPADFVLERDAENIWEAMEDCAADNDYGHADRNTFQLKDPEGGLKAFTTDLKAVVQKHFRGDIFFTMDGPLKSVPLPPPERESDGQ